MLHATVDTNALLKTTMGTPVAKYSDATKAIDAKPVDTAREDEGIQNNERKSCSSGGCRRKRCGQGKCSKGKCCVAMAVGVPLFILGSPILIPALIVRRCVKGPCKCRHHRCCGNKSAAQADAPKVDLA